MTVPTRADDRNRVAATHIGGGRSARLIAVIVAGTLVAVVWIAISGRPPVPEPARPSPAVARASVAATPARPSTDPSLPSAASPAPTDAARSRSFLNVAATIGGRQYLAELEQVSTRLLRGSLAIPIPPPATRGKLALSQVWLTGSHDAWTTFGEFDLRLEALSGASGREYVVLEGSRRPGGSDHFLPVIASRGYDITARAQSGVPVTMLIVELRLAAGNIVGDDGLVGCRAFRTCDSVLRDRATTR